MSLATLARKSRVKQRSLSTDEGFSLKGTRRNIHGVGNINLNSPVRPLLLGTVPRGHGQLKPRTTRRCGTTNCTKYPVQILCNNGTTSTGGSCVPNSTLNTKGYIQSHLIYPTDCPEGKCKMNWTKSFNPLDHSQSMHIRKVKVRLAGCETNEAEQHKTDIDPCVENCDNTYMLGTRRISRNTHHKDVNKGAISAGEYTEINVLSNNCLPPPPCKQPFPMIINKNGCFINYLTPEEAKIDGVLPDDWLNCSNSVSTSQQFLTNPY